MLNITGVAGVGKTELVRQFLDAHPRVFQPVWLDVFPGIKFDQIIAPIEEILTRDNSSKRILIIDCYGDFDIDYFVSRIRSLKTIQSVIMSRSGTHSNRTFTLRLKGLPIEEANNLLSVATLRPLSFGDIHTLVSRVDGNPKAILTIAHLLKDQTVQQILAQLDGGLRDLSLSVSANEEQVSKIVVPKIIVANESLIESLKQHPKDLYKVSPRRFEELIAELLDDMGWEVKMTPQSKDGGKDIIAVLDTAIGKLLCLVEAKRYSDHRPVQVGLVRQLYGTFMDHGANSAMLVTSSRFTRGAREFQSKHQYQITLKEYDDIVDWIQRYKSNVSPNSRKLNF